MLKSLIEKIDNMWDHIDDFSRETEIKRKNQMEMLGKKKHSNGDEECIWVQ